MCLYLSSGNHRPGSVTGAESGPSQGPRNSFHGLTWVDFWVVVGKIMAHLPPVPRFPVFWIETVTVETRFVFSLLHHKWLTHLLPWLPLTRWGNRRWDSEWEANMHFICAQCYSKHTKLILLYFQFYWIGSGGEEIIFLQLEDLLNLPVWMVWLPCRVIL